jgi:predicted acylesterase/phospholipase RssA
MARLAECDVLRSVETLSTVSGGSILGAHYYLELRYMLQTRPDAMIGRDDYLELMRRLIAATVDGVQNNMRVRALRNFWANLKMIFMPGYSRSMRMGELYEKLLYDKVCDADAHEGMRQLRSLMIQPAGGKPGLTAGPGFSLKRGNWLRRAKVPNLMLNTTSLNTGHTWHFTARWMGEPPGLMGTEIDINERYRRVYYDDAPNEKLKAYPLAYAAAASSCVPALFEPLPLKGLYRDRVVRLVDGGVHDNQGIEALLNDGCDFILCSDASGQMDSQVDPANGMAGVFWRSDGILQDRVRETQYRDVKAKSDAGALQGLFFVHMRQELETEPIAWIGAGIQPGVAPGSTATSYGIDRDLQRMLSEIRTDLDTFTEVESYALMASGYQLTDWQLRELDKAHKASGLPGTWGGFDITAPMAVGSGGKPIWPFAPLIPLMALPHGSSDLRRKDLAVQLKAGAIMFGRVWHLLGWLRALAVIAGLAGFALAAIALYENWDEPVGGSYSATVGGLFLSSVFIVGPFISPLFKFLNPSKATQNALLNSVVAVFGCIASNLYLWTFDKLLKNRGRLTRLLK